MSAAGYSYIPYYGSLIGDFSGFMNGPALVSGGERSLTVSYFVNIIQYVSYMLSAFLFINNSESNIYLIFVVIVIVLAVFDAFEEGKDIIPNSRRLEITDFCCKKKNAT